MYCHWTGYAFYWYFKLEGYVVCIRFIPKLDKFSKDKRRFAWWRLK